MIRKETKEKLASLKESDIYSLVLFAVFELRKDPKYAVLSEMSYVLDGKALMDFLTYFGGMTIRIPTMRELKLIINALLLYQYVNIEGIDFKQALELLEDNDYSLKETKEAYNTIVEVCDKYEFSRQ